MKTRRSEAKDSEPQPYDPEPIFFFPDKCPRCGGEGCMMCKEPERLIRAARLPDMTIRRRP
jgi:hypothetical protein